MLLPKYREKGYYMIRVIGYRKIENWNDFDAMNRKTHTIIRALFQYGKKCEPLTQASCFFCWHSRTHTYAIALLRRISFSNKQWNGCTWISFFVVVANLHEFADSVVSFLKWPQFLHLKCPTHYLGAGFFNAARRLPNLEPCSWRHRWVGCARKSSLVGRYSSASSPWSEFRAWRSAAGNGSGRVARCSRHKCGTTSGHWSASPSTGSGSHGIAIAPVPLQSTGPRSSVDHRRRFHCRRRR